MLSECVLNPGIEKEEIAHSLLLPHSSLKCYQ